VLTVIASLLAASPAADARDCHTKRKQDRPFSLGVSGGNVGSIGGGYCCTGTLGSLVQDSDGNQFVLSCNHVLATIDDGQIVVQPGLADLSCQQNLDDEIADSVTSIPITKGRGKDQPNTIDAAIAAVLPDSVDSQGTILNIGEVAAGGAVTPTLGLEVQKMGRTSCLSKGHVTAVHATIKVNYDPICSSSFSGVATFKEQILINPGTFAAPGDSGSLVVTRGGCPGAVGLLFALSNTEVAANPMSAVLSDFGVSMVGNSCTPTITRAAALQSASASGSLQPEPKEVAAAAAVAQRHTAALLNIPGVVGTGVGQSPEGKLVIKVFVEKDTPRLRASLPSSLESIPVEIEETGPMRAY
jgi:hypothetical protein